MTQTEQIIKLLEEWYNDTEYENLVDSIRWLIRNRDDIDKEYCIEWLNNHNEAIEGVRGHYKSMQIANIINNKIITEEVREVRK